MRKIGILLGLFACLMLATYALASWKGTGLRLGITTEGSNTSFMQSVSHNSLDVTNGTYTGLAVGSANIVKADNSDGEVNVAGLSGGYDGQVVQVVVTKDNGNNVTLQHGNSTGSQQIFLQNESDQSLATYGGWTLVCNGTAWFEVDN